MTIVDSNQAADCAIRAARECNDVIANQIVRTWCFDREGRVDEARALGLLHRWTEPARRDLKGRHLHVNLDRLPPPGDPRRDRYVTACTLLVAFANGDQGGAALLFETVPETERLPVLRAALAMVAHGNPSKGTGR